MCTCVISPRRACAARVTVVVSCVCVRVCLSGHAILAVCVVKSITKDTIVLSVRFEAILKIIVFFLKLPYPKVRAFFTYLDRGGHFKISNR